MLSGFSSYFFGGDDEGQVQVTQDGSVSQSAESAESSDWVFVENPGKRQFAVLCCILTNARRNVDLLVYGVEQWT